MSLLGLGRISHDVSLGDALSEAVGVAMGFASTCWEPKPEGVFEPDLAGQATQELIDFLLERTSHLMMRSDFGERERRTHIMLECIRIAAGQNATNSNAEHTIGLATSYFKCAMAIEEKEKVQGD